MASRLTYQNAEQTVTPMTETSQTNPFKTQSPQFNLPGSPQCSCHSEVEQLQAQLLECQKDRDKLALELEKSAKLRDIQETQILEYQRMSDQEGKMKQVYINTLISYLTQLEEKHRKERRMWLNEQAIKLGRITAVR